MGERREGERWKGGMSGDSEVFFSKFVARFGEVFLVRCLWLK